jgi:hypothetical protein
MMDTFERWQPAVSEYFQSFLDERYNDAGRHWFITPGSDITIQREGSDLVVGSAGCDLIDFCFRNGSDGVWAYYPIDDEYVLVAATLNELETGWKDGSIKV